MTRLLLILLLVSPLGAALNDSVMLDSIAAVETGNQDLRGARGERGPWQLMPKVAAQVGGYDRVAAARWLVIVKRDLARRGVWVSSHSVALAWNVGARLASEGRAPVSTYLYADRVCNVYQSRLVRALGRPLNKSRETRLTPGAFCVPCVP